MFPEVKPESNSKQKLAVAAVCQDVASGECAKQLLNRVSQLVGPDGIQCTWWPIHELVDSGIFQKAVAGAACADVIIVAIRAEIAFSNKLLEWVEAWLPARKQRDGSLIALIDPAGQTSASFQRTRDYFRSAARRGGLDFQLRERNSPGSLPRLDPSDVQVQ